MQRLPVQCASRQSHRHFVIFMLVQLIFLGGPLLACSSNSSKETIGVYFLNPDGSRSPDLRAELARTPGEHQLGLMYRRSMGEQESMLFIFPEEAPRSFWMKNTYLSLDIIYLDADRRVVSIAANAVPLSETPRPSGKAAKYALEILGGLSAKWGIVPGSEMKSDTAF